MMVDTPTPSTISYTFACKEELQDELIALLEDDGVSGFHQEDSEMTVFCEAYAAERVAQLLDTSLARYLDGIPVRREIAQRNWNAEWEKTIQPIPAGQFRIRPTWHESPVPEGMIDIIVDPKMSFGTGYHESTRLLLYRIGDMVEKGDKVLDAGTGTGVLAFAALLAGAATADAFDTDPLCIENATENAVLNGMQDRFQVYEGNETVAPDSDYDVVLANINREALRSMLPTLRNLLRPDGLLGMAGLLKTDREVMRASIEAASMVMVDESDEGEWWSVWVKKTAK